jgi:hypothetical protein
LDSNGDVLEIADDDHFAYKNYDLNRSAIERISHEELDEKEKSLLEAAHHVEEAMSMRELANRKICECKASADKPRSERVITICCDYAQNGELPSYGNEQPGETYYFSPLTVNIFGVVDTNQDDHMLTAYCYDEVVGKKGGNNVTSLLMKHLDDKYSLNDDDPYKELNILLDNCLGQNKNRMVLRMVAYLVELGFFKAVNFLFYAVGHTKNPCDQLFNLAKMSIRRHIVFSMDEFITYCGGHPLVTAKEVFETDFADYDKLFNQIYIPFINWAWGEKVANFFMQHRQQKDGCKQ